MIEPKCIKRGSIIHVLCPSFSIDSDEHTTFFRKCRNEGLNIIIKKSFNADRENVFALDREKRLLELQASLNDKACSAIFTGRGGYGISQLIDDIDWSVINMFPKWIIGYSDITLLHLALFTKINLLSLHSFMVNDFKKPKIDSYSIDNIFGLLKGKKLDVVIDKHIVIVNEGEAMGPLIGGNLSMIAHAVGNEFFPKFDNTILVLEDVDEYIYRIERMLFQLIRAKVFDKLQGLILGTFTDMKVMNKHFGMDIEAMFKTFFGDKNYPIVYNFPIGHSTKNIPFKHGARHKLILKNSKAILKEL